MSTGTSEEPSALEQLAEQLGECECELAQVRHAWLRTSLKQQNNASPAAGCFIAQVEAQVEALLARQQRLQERRDQLRQSISQEERCPRRDWQAEFAWDVEALDVLASVFGLRHFRCVVSRLVSAPS
jgi:hypothetical protein